MSKEQQNIVDITYICGDKKFNYRVAALIIINEKLLVMRDMPSGYAYLPGGRVLLGEVAEKAIVRELKEELNLIAEIERPLWLSQSFFFEVESKKEYHELCLYFLIKDGVALLPKNSLCSTFETKDKQHYFEWVKFEQLANIDFYPLFLKNKIFDLPRNLTLLTEHH